MWLGLSCDEEVKIIYKPRTSETTSTAETATETGTGGRSLVVIHADRPATCIWVLDHLEVVQRHSEVSQQGITQFLQLAQRFIFHLRHLLIVQPLQSSSVIVLKK